MEQNIKRYFDFGKEIIKKINQNGAEAYFVGECVRNVILKKPIKEVHLFTTANNTQLLEIFKDYIVTIYNEDTVRLNYMDYIFYISTFKLLVEKQVRNMVNRHYCTALMDYLERKDFIIDALAMNYSNKVIDPFDARACIRKKVIKVYGDAKIRFNEKPIRILKALSLVSQLGYRLDRNVCKGIVKRRKLLEKVPVDLIALEMRDIISGSYSKRAINLLAGSKAYKRLSIFKPEIVRLAKKFRKETIDEFLINVMVSNGEMDYSILKAADNEEFVKNTVNLALTNPKADYDVLTLFRNGLDVCLAANKSNRLWKKSKNKNKKIIKVYNELPIKKTCDLAFKGQDILEVTQDGGGKYLEQLIDDIQAEILFGNLRNEYEAIRVFVYRRLYEMKNAANESINFIKPKEEVIEKEEKHLEQQPIVQEDEFDEMIEDEDLQDIVEENSEVKDYNSKSIEDALFEERIRQINLDALEDKLNRQIDELIKKSNILDEMKGNEAIDTYNRMKKRYREVLLDKYPEYSKLKDRYHDK